MVERIIAKEPNEMGLSRKRTSSVMTEHSDARETRDEPSLSSSRLTEANDMELVRTL